MFMVLMDSGRCNYPPFKEMTRVCELLTWDCDFISDSKEQTRVSKEFVEKNLNEKEPNPIPSVTLSPSIGSHVLITREHLNIEE